MNRPTVNPLGIAILIAICVVVFVPAVFQSRADGIAKWVFEYQTLIGGLFAIAAAYVTVVHMRASDFDNDERHRELISLSLRADRLRVDRAFSRADDYRKRYGAISFFSAELKIDDDDEERATKMVAIMPSCARARSRAVALRSYLDRTEVSGCGDLFDGEMQIAYEKAHYAAGVLIDMLDVVIDARGPFEHRAIYQDERYANVRAQALDRAADRNDWEHSFEYYNAACGQFFEHAGRLHSTYMSQKYGGV